MVVNLMHYPLFNDSKREIIFGIIRKEVSKLKPKGKVPEDYKNMKQWYAYIKSEYLDTTSKRSFKYWCNEKMELGKAWITTSANESCNRQIKKRHNKENTLDKKILALQKVTKTYSRNCIMSEIEPRRKKNKQRIIKSLVLCCIRYEMDDLSLYDANFDLIGDNVHRLRELMMLFKKVDKLTKICFQRKSCFFKLARRYLNMRPENIVHLQSYFE